MITFGRGRVRLYVAWYDAWIGVFVDRHQRRIYLQPLPCRGVRIDWGTEAQDG